MGWNQFQSIWWFYWPGSGFIKFCGSGSTSLLFFFCRKKDNPGEYDRAEHREEASDLQYQACHLQHAQVEVVLTSNISGIAWFRANILFKVRVPSFCYSKCNTHDIFGLQLHIHFIFLFLMKSNYKSLHKKLMTPSFYIRFWRF